MTSSDTLSPVPEGPQKNYCRICLQQCQPLQKLPCKCRGSLSYMHNQCLNKMLHVKLSSQKEDSPDYIEAIPSSPFSHPNENVKAKCEICLEEIVLEKELGYDWMRLGEVGVEVYLVLVGIGCICGLGVKVGVEVLGRALQEEAGVFVRVLCLGAYVWIVGVMLYVLLQPIYSQIRVTNFRIKPQSPSSNPPTSPNSPTSSKWKYYLTKLIPYEFLKLNEQIKQKTERSRRQHKNSQKQRKKSRSHSRTKITRDRMYEDGMDGGRGRGRGRGRGNGSGGEERYSYFQI